MSEAQSHLSSKLRTPEVLLALMAVGLPLSFSTWNALLNNYVIETLHFDGADIGLLHTVREIPGFLAISVIALLVIFREQPLALFTLAMLGLATAMTALIPTTGWMLLTTFVGSIGFHYHATLYESLQLQWLPKARAPQMMGWYMAIGSGATFVAYLMIVLLWQRLNLSYNLVFGIAGGATVALTVFCALAFPTFKAPVQQKTHLVLKRRYWLYYALQFFSGARRQIFIVFAGFMMVERYGFAVHEVTALFLINLVANMIFAPVIGHAVGRWGERRALIIEYVGLIIVFSCYAGLYIFNWGVVFASALYVIDHMLFAMAIAMRTYFQKISDPEDIAPTAAVTFTINHIAAVALPIPLGLLWLYSPTLVFVIASMLAVGSLILALMVPRHPLAGHETRPILKLDQT